MTCYCDAIDIVLLQHLDTVPSYTLDISASPGSSYTVLIECEEMVREGRKSCIIMQWKMLTGFNFLSNPARTDLNFQTKK